MDRNRKPEEKRIGPISQAQMKKDRRNSSSRPSGKPSTGKSGSRHTERHTEKSGGGRNHSKGWDDRSSGGKTDRKGRDRPLPREAGREKARDFDYHRDGRDRNHAFDQPRGKSSKIHISLFGSHAVREAILNPARDIKAIYATDATADEMIRIMEEAHKLGVHRPEPMVVDRDLLDRSLPKGTVHQGVACDAVPLEEVFLPELLNRAAQKERSVLVMLDQVTDPHNMGAILRSACAFGADGVIVQSRNAPELGGIVAKTASGAVEHLPVVYETNLARTIESLKERGYFALAMDERGAQTLAEAPKYDRTLLVLGAEGPGLRPLIREHCDVLLRLPTGGKFSSLNVSNAAAVALYAVIAG